MRLGLALRKGQESELASLAESHGLFGVLAGLDDPMTAITAAVYASTSTQLVRIGAIVRLGVEHPVMIAEELAILDNVNNGRTFVVADTSDLDVDAASDELAVLREALASRPLQHRGARWTVPAGIPANATAPKALSVTPKPTQLEIAFWLTGHAAPATAAAAGLAIFARDPARIEERHLVQPGLATLGGDLGADRSLVTKWAEAGASHLFLNLPAGREAELMTQVSRHLAPEVGMPHFPRVMSESSVPLSWPGAHVDRKDSHH